MDRVMIYPGAIPLETDLLNTNKNTMIAIAKLAAAMLGTSTVANGFAVTPTSPASLQVLAGAGEIYSLVNIDSSAYSSLAADTAHQILKQGILLDAATLNCPAPTTSGQSINYLVQAAYQDSDITPVVLPYYNASNPSQAYSGPNNSGTAQYTNRSGAAVVNVKAGASATTGSQVTPSPDSGFVGLYVVTVAYGQTTITAGNISKYSAAPLLPAGLLPAHQSGALNYALDTGTANTYAAAYAPAITTLTDGMVLRFKALNANTGASTFNPNGLGAKAIVGGAHAALQGGEIIVSSDVWLQYNSSIGGGSWILVDSTGGAIQTANATQSQQAVAMGQLTSVVGAARNVRMYVSAASASATLTADEVVVESALGGLSYRLASVSKTINLATTGAGGMDTGTAPVSGFVAVYLIYNPTTGVSALLATNATSAVATEVYGGANMPSGYTASALLSVWGTTAASLFKIGLQVDRSVQFAAVSVLSTTVTSAQSTTSLSVASAVPKNAKKIQGIINTSSSVGTGGAVSLNIYGDSTLIGQFSCGGAAPSLSAGCYSPFSAMAMATAQTMYWSSSFSGSVTTQGLGINVSGYDF